MWRVRTAACTAGWSRLQPPPGADLLDGGEEVVVSLRDAVVARSGCVLLSADYSQIEMRVSSLQGTRAA